MILLGFFSVFFDSNSFITLFKRLIILNLVSSKPKGKVIILKLFSSAKFFIIVVFPIPEQFELIISTSIKF